MLLLTALVVWHSAARFGPLRSEPPPGRRSKEEFLDAMAELLSRKGDRAEAFRTVRDDFRRRLEEAFGLSPSDRPGVVADAHRSMLRHPGWPRLSTTYFASTDWSRSG